MTMKGYRPALDGVRAVAVVAVMLYHGGVSWMPAGFLGVDIFFVLSGYLITSLLLSEWVRWRAIDIVDFYRRRARRLLPALVLLVVATAIGSQFLAEPSQRETIRGDGIATLLYVANWRFILVGSSYFDQFAEPSPFRHMWSLAIEEQFYLFFPLLLVGLVRWARGRPWALPGALAALAALSVADMAWRYVPGTDTSTIYYGTDTRIHELLIGSLLAVLMRRHAQTWRTYPVAAQAAAALGLLGVLIALTQLNDQSSFLYRGGFAIVCLLTAVMVAAIEVAPTSWIAQALSLRPVVWVGMISYGLYLWHWPLYVALTPDRTGLDGTPLLTLRLLATFAIASLSYYLVEHPIRQGALTRIPSGRTIAALGMPLALAALLLGTTSTTTTAANPTTPPTPRTISPNATQPGQGQGQIRVHLIGDSVPLGLSNRFPAAEFPDLSVSSSTLLGCHTFPEPDVIDGRPLPWPEGLNCAQWEAGLGAAVDRAAPDVGIVMIGIGEQFDKQTDSGILPWGTAEHDAWLRQRIEQRLALFTGRNIPTLVITTPCHQVEDSGLSPTTAVINDDERARHNNDILVDVARQAGPSVTVYDLYGAVCSDGYQEVVDGVTLREDGLHFSDAGASYVWGLLDPVINEMVATSRAGR